MSETSFLELAFDITFILCALDHAVKDPGIIAGIMKIIPLTIIHPSPHKKKIDPCCGRKISIDVLDSRIVREHPAQVDFSALPRAQISYR